MFTILVCPFDFRELGLEMRRKHELESHSHLDASRWVKFGVEVKVPSEFPLFSPFSWKAQEMIQRE